VIYLIAQIALFLFLASLVGLALGWLIWGELARRIRTEAKTLQSKLADLEARYRSSLSERDEFEKRLAEREADIGGLRKRVLEPELPEGQIRELQEKMKSAINDREGVIAQLRARVKEIEGQHRASVDSMEERLAASDTRERSLSARLLELEPHLVERDGTIAGLRNQLNDWDARQAASAAEKDAQAAGLMARIQNLESLARDLSAAQNQIRSLEVQQFALVSEQKELQNSLTEKKSEIAALQRRIAEAESAAQKAMAQANTKEAGMAGLQERIRQLEESARQAEINTLSNFAEVLTQRLPHQEVTNVAHSYAAARNFQGGSEHEDWSRAENEVRVRMLREKLATEVSSAAGGA
jgi:chromosome segregation ATPase